MISLVTVNYKTKAYVERMLASLERFRPSVPHEVFIVENGSGDDLSALEARFPWATFLSSDTNLGFAGGCNLAIEKAKGEYVILVNPDIEFTEDAVSALAARMEAEPSVGIGGIALKNKDGSQQECVWRFPTPLNQLQILFKLPHVFPRLKAYRAWKMRDFDYAKSADVDQVMGAFFGIRRAVLNAIGPLDDGFFMWYEEVDFCRRAKDAGWRVRYFADVSARHRGGSSFEKVGTRKKQAMIRRSLRRYMKKHYGRGAWLLFVVLDPFFVLAGFLASLVKPV